jgi:ribosomal protein S12 methylthiotransferase accessory factor
MSEALYPDFTCGTHRLSTPEQTLARLLPLLPTLGITRLADISGLDQDLGVPTYSAIRPGGLVLQTSNGKGLTRTAAKVSALMEAAEFHHAENPDTRRFTRASLREMRRLERFALVPARDRADRSFYWSPDAVIDWVEGEELLTGRPVWTPASASFFVQPTIYQTTTHGLGSGDHMVEATLHALYEILERDAISRLLVGEVLAIRERCRMLDLATVADDTLAGIFAKLRAAGSQLVLLWVPAKIPVHVFWAFLLDHRPHHASAALSAGAGAHLDIHVAAARAVTEAVQSRLTVIQGARDDIMARPSFTRSQLTPGPASRYFTNLVANATWKQLVDAYREPLPARWELRACLAYLLRCLQDGGHEHVLRVDLRHPGLDIPIVKVFVPSLSFHRALF